jgi:LuxR family transcriptional regulator, maltose regulon positive regulatory protein
MEGHPTAAIWASFTAAFSGRSAEAERWADAADRWLKQDMSPAADPFAEALAIALRYTLCRDGVEQMRADADQAVHRWAAAGRNQPTVSTAHGIARVLRGDLDGGDAFLAEAVRIGDRELPMPW